MTAQGLQYRDNKAEETFYHIAQRSREPSPRMMDFHQYLPVQAGLAYPQLKTSLAVCPSLHNGEKQCEE